jgi:hypothetical protein
MKKLVIVVKDGCVENVFIDTQEKIELEIVDFDSTFDSQDEQEAMEDYVEHLQQTMKEV